MNKQGHGPAAQPGRSQGNTRPLERPAAGQGTDPVAIFAELVKAIDDKDFRAATSLQRQLKGLGFVVWARGPRKGVPT